MGAVVNDNRHPAGTSVGGQWAPGAAGEVDDSLDVESEGGRHTEIGELAIDNTRGTAVYTGQNSSYGYVRMADGTFKRECPRCAGRGRMAEYQNVHGGVCFKCGDSRVDDSAGIIGGVADIKEDAKKRDDRRGAYLDRKERERISGLNEREEQFNDFMSATPARAQAWAEAENDPKLKEDLIGIRNSVRVPGKREELWGVWVDRHIERRAEQQARAAERASGPKKRHLDVPVGGKVEDKPMKLARSVDIENNFGPRPVPAKMLIFESDSGEMVKINSTSMAAFDASVGDQMSISGTVKEHGQYRDEPQTSLRRPKMKPLTSQ